MLETNAAAREIESRERPTGAASDARLAPLFEHALTPEFRQWLYVMACCDLARESSLISIDRSDQRQQMEALTEKAFSELVLEGRPTFAIFTPHALCGSVIMAMAAQQMSTGSLRIPNFVFVPELDFGATALAEAPDGRRGLIARRGLLVDEFGTQHYGDFPKPLWVDAVYDTHTWPFEGRERSDLGVINGQGASDTARDKILTKMFLERNGLPCAPSACFHSGQYTSEEILPAVRDFMRESSLRHVVVKPAGEAQGRGVTLHENANAEEVAECVKAALTRYGSCMVEGWIRSFPYLGEDGRRLDWNMRVLVSSSGVIDLEARIGEWGKPVNKCRGASIGEVWKVYRDLQEQRPGNLPPWPQFFDSLNDLSLKAARLLKAGYMGLDAILDEDGALQIVELNCGNVGGMTSLAEMRVDTEDQLRAPARFVELLALRLGSRRIFSGEPRIVSERAWPPTSDEDVANLLLNSLQDIAGDHNVPILRGAEDFMFRAAPGLETWMASELLGRLAAAYFENGLAAECLRLMQAYKERYPDSTAYDYLMDGASEAVGQDAQQCLRAEEAADQSQQAP